MNPRIAFHWEGLSDSQQRFMREYSIFQKTKAGSSRSLQAVVSRNVLRTYFQDKQTIYPLNKFDCCSNIFRKEGVREGTEKGTGRL